MPMISFSGETSQGPFWKQILEGHKTQTCRAPRKRPIRERDNLLLYWKVRVRKDMKPIHYIGGAICTKVERKRYIEFAYDDDFARRDGFKNSAELREWFGTPSDEEYDVITFRLIQRFLVRE